MNSYCTKLDKSLAIINSCTSVLQTVVAARWLGLASNGGYIDTETYGWLRDVLTNKRAELWLEV